MKIEFAPMEGITGYVFRRAHRALFSGISEYYLPFIATHATRTLKKKELDDLAWENNVIPGEAVQSSAASTETLIVSGFSNTSAVSAEAIQPTAASRFLMNTEDTIVVPQLLTKNADDCLWYLSEFRQMGYRKVNLNFGCPSPTVTAKGKGAAILGDLEGLRRLLDGIFSGNPGVRISVKTRLGIAEMSEFSEILPIYNSFPLDELIVHGRTLAETYQGNGHPELLPEIAALCKCPLSYNGNIFFPEDAMRVKILAPQGLSAFMIGRGLLRNPALAREIAGGPPLTDEELSRFLTAVYRGYRETLPGPVPVLGRMKELWFYVEDLYEAPEPGTEAFRQLRNLRKARAFPAYEAAQAAFFAKPPARKQGKARWQM